MLQVEHLARVLWSLSQHHSADQLITQMQNEESAEVFSPSKFLSKP